MARQTPAAKHAVSCIVPPGYNQDIVICGDHGAGFMVRSCLPIATFRDSSEVGGCADSRPALPGWLGAGLGKLALYIVLRPHRRCCSWHRCSPKSELFEAKSVGPGAVTPQSDPRPSFPIHRVARMRDRGRLPHVCHCMNEVCVCV